MKTSTKIIVGAVIVLALFGAFGLGWYLHQNHELVGAVSPAGTTNSTPRIAQITFAPSTGNATSTSMLNTDANDRVISTVDESCVGLGVSQTGWTGAGLLSLGLIFTASTSSVPTPVNNGTLANTNYVLDNSNTIATTTPALYFIASSTPGAIGNNPTFRIWNAGSYLTIQANATNTASCQIRVGYLPE